MDTENIAAVILAAGRSSRMGSFKPLLALGGRTLVERQIELFRRAGITDVRVVVGHCRGRLEPLLERAGATVIVNPDYGRGMFSSVLAALESMGPEIRAAFIMPVDIPLAGSQTIQVLLRRQAEEPEKILAPAFQGKRGHPVLIPAQFFGAIKRWQGGEGLRGALREFDDQTLIVPGDDPNILLDLDTPADYEKLAKQWDRVEVAQS